MKMLKPTIRTIDTRTAKAGSGTKRLTGNSRIAAVKKFTRENARLCATCTKLGLVGFGDELDHIVPLWMGGAESDSNRQWLCREHHLDKTAEEYKLRSSGGVK